MAKSKYDRLAMVRELVTTATVSSQEELLTQLQQRGFSVTQATLSRDIKELKIAKVPDAAGGYRYMIQEAHAVAMPHQPSIDGANLLRAGVHSLEFSGQLAVVKTRPGYASVVAELIDSRHAPEIMGTLAGDDTVLLVLRQSAGRDEVLRSLSTVIPNIQNRLI